ncbi:hypothetical protein N9578_00035 [bacterium]|nr:hypothetical protein [bacterium]MDB4128430.1 hypothetical protein [bacterium]
MNLIVSLYISVLVLSTGQPMSIVSQMKFNTIEQCESFVLNQSKGYDYFRNNEGALVLTVPSTGNIITAKCFIDEINDAN